MPGRRLGQHFLIRQSILDRIARAACPGPEPLVIEIGPGKGALTGPLLQHAARVVAIEVDPLMVMALRDRFAAEPGIEIIERDVLETDLAQWGTAVVAGNLPYYITSPILEKVLSLGSLLSRAVFLVQQEVAERLTAEPGSRDYGYLSVMTQVLADATMLFTVPPAAFRPPPQVNSAVVHLAPRDPKERFGIDDLSGFQRFASVCFRQKRKTLRNNLISAYPKDRVERLKEAGLRAEQISIEGLASIYRELRVSEAIGLDAD